MDRGKDGKLSIDLHKAGMITLARHYNEQFSEDWKPQANQWMDEMAYIRDGLKDRGFKDMSEVQLMLGSPNVKITEQEDPDEKPDGKTPATDNADESDNPDDDGSQVED